jgi:hypothetical protein
MNYSAKFLVIAILVGLAIRIIMHFVDKSRIKEEIESKGGRVLSIAWNPFARGSLRRMSDITRSVTSTGQDKRCQRRARRACSLESTGLKGRS